MPAKQSEAPRMPPPFPPAFNHYPSYQYAPQRPPFYPSKPRSMRHPPYYNAARGDHYGGYQRGGGYYPYP